MLEFCYVLSECLGFLTALVAIIVALLKRTKLTTICVLVIILLLSANYYFMQSYTRVPDVEQIEYSFAKGKLYAAGLKITTDGEHKSDDDKVESQSINKGAIVKKGQTIILTSSDQLKDQTIKKDADTFIPKTQYRYHRYIDSNGESAVCAGLLDRSTVQIEYTDWLDTPLPIDEPEGIWYRHVRLDNCAAAGCIDPTCYTDRYNYNGQYFFYEETRTVSVKATDNP